MDLAHCRLTPDFIFLHVSGGGMNCVSCDIYVECILIVIIYANHLWFVCVFSLGYSSAPE